MELGIIRQINIDAEMQASYLDYAMSVIVARALPDVRDGLKPVHRRILYAMHDLGLSPDKPYKKSARLVGEVLGKYHPHGDVAVYEAMVRMAQDFSLRYPLVDGQGNFGSIDGDNAAAMRYTEARLARIAEEVLNDIEKDTVDWTDNFDGTLKEPTVLPAALPNLLINGASGIAVGMATNIPPHNLNEICDALCYLIDHFDHHDDVTVEDLMQFIPGPDFPTGGVVYRYATEGSGAAAEQVDVIAQAYVGGKGSIVMQAKAHIEEMSRNRNRIVVTELPYMVNKTNLLERIADLVRDGRLEGITDLRDESDRTGMRICIEMTRTVEPRQVLADLFKLTPLQTTFGVSMLALVDGEPRLLSLKRMLLHYVEHRQEVIVRRTRYDLARAEQRAHILEGLLRALDVLDEVIALIRKSRTADTARQNLIEQFKFTAIQAQAILDMQLRRLAALERRKLQDEYRDVLALVKELTALLGSPEKVLALIRQNLLDLKTHYGDARRTQIADRVKGTLTAMDVLPDQDVWITLSGEGILMRQRREFEARFDAQPATGGVQRLLAANTRHDLYLVSHKGQVTRVHAHQIPEAPGGHFADLSGFSRRDRVVAMFSLPKPTDETVTADGAGACLQLATAQGKVKRVLLTDLLAVVSTDPIVIGLDEGDETIWAGVGQAQPGGEFILVTATGQAIRFSEEGVRPMGLPAGGIGGIKLAAKDQVIAASGVSPATTTAHLAIITSSGYGKRVPVADFPVQGRNGQGVVVAKLSSKSGDIAGAALVTPDDLLVCVYAKAAPQYIPAAEFPEAGRPALGKPIAALLVGEPVRGAYAVPVTAAPTMANESPGPADARSSAQRAGTLEPAASAPAKAKRGTPATAPSQSVAAERAAGPAKSPTKVIAKQETGARKTAAVKTEPATAGTDRKPRAAGKSAPNKPESEPSAGSPSTKPVRNRGKADEAQLSLIPPATAPGIAGAPAEPTAKSLRARSGDTPKTPRAAPDEPAKKPASTRRKP